MSASGRRTEAGLSLVECLAALALAGLILASTMQASRAAAAVLGEAREASSMLDLTRELLEHQIGAPCGPAPECPPGLECSVARHAVTATVDRIVVDVSREDGGRRERLATLAPPPACSGG